MRLTNNMLSNVKNLYNSLQNEPVMQEGDYVNLQQRLNTATTNANAAQSRISQLSSQSSSLNSQKNQLQSQKSSLEQQQQIGKQKADALHSYLNDFTEQEFVEVVILGDD